ncbi:MAG: hypothetical protein IJ666_07480 [Ruminococcus sp.]|nr:hypothetical protein [Ruminococcus sp.]
MFENALTYRNVSFGRKIAYKTLISAGLVAMAVILPQLVHLALGAPGGVQWLPMYLPVLVGGCLLGAKWGLAVGMLSPLVSFIITSAFGNPMPVAARLPFMMAELAVFALVSGMFTNKITKNGLWAFPAVILAQVTGRAAFLGLIALTQSMTQFTAAVIWQQIQTGFIGLAVQAVLVPVIIIGLKKLMVKDND